MSSIPENVSSTSKIVIVGSGPTGLGAAIRLTELGHTNWTLIEEGDSPGGLSRSYVDDHGFTWDLGGHVIFSHYAYFDDVMDLAISEWNLREREAWVWVCGEWVPYPFQSNIHRLPAAELSECLDGLTKIHAQQQSNNGSSAPRVPPANFAEYCDQQFGEGIGRVFMRPYNWKVWAVPLESMSTEWTGERVATINLAEINESIRTKKDNVGWGPNATFRFPVHGGTGGIYSALAEKYIARDRIQLGSGKRVVSVDADAKQIGLADKSTVSYDYLISTVPLDSLLGMTRGTCFNGKDTAEWPAIADGFCSSSVHVIGIGLRGSVPEHLRTKCWMYFPDPEIPFYRCTVFSNYSSYNAPPGHWSLMLEVSESKLKHVNHDTVLDECINGCILGKLMREEDRANIVSKWTKFLVKGYPTPFIGRNALLEKVLPDLKANHIYSRGRFGAWKYEVSNQDHSLMQGVEAVNDILGISVEETVHDPKKVNGKKGTLRCTLAPKL